MVPVSAPKPSSPRAKEKIGQWCADRFSRNVGEGYCLMFKDEGLGFLESLVQGKDYFPQNEPMIDHLTKLSNNFGTKSSARQVINDFEKGRMQDMESTVFEHSIGNKSITPYLPQEAFRSYFREHAGVVFKFLKFPLKVDGILRSDEVPERHYTLMDKAWKDVFGSSKEYHRDLEKIVILSRNMLSYMYEFEGCFHPILSCRIERSFLQRTAKLREQITLQMFKDL